MQEIQIHECVEKIHLKFKIDWWNFNVTDYKIQDTVS